MVYVGQLFGTARSHVWHWDQACHLYADTDDELAEFSKKIGLKKQWWQNPGTRQSHFDLIASLRAKALAAGAIEHKGHEEGKWLIARRGKVPERGSLRLWNSCIIDQPQ